ncbi:hypothetical protein Trco_005194 [Trichoderma cornu-damae]|uniref:Cell wall protein n=1 Tax=Trichoderma cornu-damae TaxID=654480 RepID=A0A9P8QGZ4_9HYPO|nr:hypothetical protein Trco_005194 [Trichoderma cornu-damae]
MAAPKMTMALASLLLSGAFAITPYSDGQATVTVEPQQIGSTTSNVLGILIYSMNCCTVVESTQCQVSLSTATDAVPPESSAAYSAPVVEPTTQDAYPATSAVVDTIAHGWPVPTTVVTEVAPGAPQPTSQPAATVVSATEGTGNPTLETDSVLAATGSAEVTSGTLSASSSITGKQQANSTSVFTHDSPSGSMTAPSAPDRTNAGAALKAFPSIAFGVATMAVAYLI